MPTAPQDHKDGLTFTWTSERSGKTVKIPSINAIKGKQLRKYRKLEALDLLFSILEDLADEKTLAKVDDLDRADIEALFLAWQNDEATLGES